MVRILPSIALFQTPADCEKFFSTGIEGPAVEDGEVTRRLIEIPSYSRLALEFIGHAPLCHPQEDPNHECRMRPLLHRRITIRPCPLWVIFVGSACSRRSRLVRFAPKADMRELTAICLLSASRGRS